MSDSTATVFTHLQAFLVPYAAAPTHESALDDQHAQRWRGKCKCGPEQEYGASPLTEESEEQKGNAGGHNMSTKLPVA